MQKPDFLYHCTPRENLKNILKKGLDYRLSQSSLKGVFLALYPDIADNYRLMKDEDCIILKIDISLLNEELFIPDNYELQDYINQNDTIFFKWNECTYLDSLELCGQCAYIGVIPPQAIDFL